MKLLITRKIPDAGIRLLQQHPEIEIDYRQGAPLSHKQMLKATQGADAILAVIPDQINKEILASGSKLKLVAHYAVGFDNIDVAEATKRNIYVSNTPGHLTESVSEFTFGLMFAIAKHMIRADQFTREGKYKYWDPMLFMGATLMDKTLGIIGMGRIGYDLGKMAHHGLNMKILYQDVNTHIQAEKDFSAQKVTLDELLEQSDFVSVNCPLLDSTRHLIGEQQLRKMKPTAYLINTARGPIVTEAALYRALKENWIQGAALDVFEMEPNLYHPPHKRTGLEKLDNIIITPHIASATKEARIEMAVMAANNIIDVLVRKIPPTNIVNKELLQNRITALA